MAYCTQADLEKRFGLEEIAELLDRDVDGSADTDALAVAIADVDSIIDAHLRGRYELPLTVDSAMIKAIACDLVRHRLYTNTIPDHIQTQYDAAMDLLKKISKGDIVLDDQQVRTSKIIDYEANERVFTEETLDGF